MKLVFLFFKSLALAILQVFIFIGLYDSGFSFDIWWTNSSPRMGIGYGIGLYFGVRLLFFLGIINACIALRVPENKYKISSAFVCYLIFCWWFSNIASARPYKFLIILISGAAAFCVPVVLINLASKYSVYKLKQSAT